MNVPDQRSRNKYAKIFDFEGMRISILNGAGHMAQQVSHMTSQKKSMKCPAGIISVGGRLKLQIWYHLLDGTRRFGELQRLIPWASRQMLTLQLRDLERLGIIRRQVYEQRPPKVEYSLTEQGRASEPALRQLNAWAELAGIGF
jgi:DNA-binding HxlR family transcriptional regulator